jgi:pimeloyl-ACP methyl ester carboxylesterase
MADFPPREPSRTAGPADFEAPAGAAPGPRAYQPRIEPASRFVTLRGLRYHLRVWDTRSVPTAPEPSADARPMLLLLHGWMDVSASFQFVVDALQGGWRVVAPDWRGFGLTEARPGNDRADSYAFADYLGDLDALLDHLSPDAPMRIVAHSMGGNVAMLYAGIRPHRVAGLVNLEGFGLPETDPASAVGRYRRWLDELKEPASLQAFDSLEAVAQRLMKNNPRLPADKARYLATQWAQTLRTNDSRQRYVLRADPAHKRINPVPYRVDEALSCWAAAEAPVLWVASQERDSFHQFTKSEKYRRRLTVIRRLKEVNVADAGHMLHHDQPARIAGLIEDFYST